MLKAALAAQQRGFHLFPVAPGAKIPHRLAGGWGETATNDVNRIIHFWTVVDPSANIGVACKPSELLVVDLDQAKADWNLRGTEWEYLHQGYGPRVSGEDVFDEMAYKLGGEDEEDSYTYTYQVRTGSGGLHLYYQWPAHWPKPSQASPIKGVVDVRNAGGTSGGYVLAAGSVTGSGPYEVEQGLLIALPPKWIRLLVAEKPQQPRVQRPQGLLGSTGPGRFSGLVNSVRKAGEGNRNNTLLWAARSMYSDGASEAEALETLTTPAIDAGLTYQETGQTIRSAYRIQQQKEG